MRQEVAHVQILGPVAINGHEIVVWGKLTDWDVQYGFSQLRECGGQHAKHDQGQETLQIRNWLISSLFY
jgi:hypothetical protein